MKKRTRIQEFAEDRNRVRYRVEADYAGVRFTLREAPGPTLLVCISVEGVGTLADVPADKFELMARFIAGARNQIEMSRCLEGIEG